MFDRSGDINPTLRHTFTGSPEQAFIYIWPAFMNRQSKERKRASTTLLRTQLINSL